MGEDQTIDQMQAEFCIVQICRHALMKQCFDLKKIFGWRWTRGAQGDFIGKISSKAVKNIKIYFLAEVPHKSKIFRELLDLSFPLQLEDGYSVKTEYKILKNAKKKWLTTLGVKETHVQKYSLQNGMWRMYFGWWCFGKVMKWIFATIFTNRDG